MGKVDRVKSWSETYSVKLVRTIFYELVLELRSYISTTTCATYRSSVDVMFDDTLTLTNLHVFKVAGA